MSLTLFFLRHGQTEFSRDNAFSGSNVDPDLTSAGLAMAKAFADAYRTTPWAAVFASPMRRTRATAAPLCEPLGLKIEPRDGLKEMSFGKWDGQSIAQVKIDFRDEYLRWNADPASFAPTGGETACDVARRTLAVVDEINQRFAEGNILVVSHKAAIRVVLCSLLGIDLGRFRSRLACPVASVSVVEFNAQGPLLLRLADRSHLSEELRNLPGT